MEKHIPGNPNIQVVNEEGGGGVLGANLYAMQRPADGYHLISYAPSNLIPFLIGQPEVQYDISQQKPIWAQPAGRTVYAAPELGISTPSELAGTDQTVTSGGRGPTGGDLMTLLGWEALGIRTDLNIIFGYDGGGAQALAFEQGEINLNHWGTNNVITEHDRLIDSGDAVVLYTHGIVQNGEIVADPAMPDAPTILEAYEQIVGSAPSGEAWDAFMLFNELVGNGAYGTFLHADAPEEAHEILRQAMVDVVNDPEYQENYERFIGPYDSIVGDDLDAYQARWETIPQESLDWVRTFLEDEYEVSFD